MSVPNPASAQPGSPTLDLPIVRVHGSTSWRRRVLIVVAIVVAGMTPSAVSLATSRALPFDVMTSVTLSAVWLALAVRTVPALARWNQVIVAALVGATWACAAAVCLSGADGRNGWASIAIIGAGAVGAGIGWAVAGLRFGSVGPLISPVPAPQSPSTRTAFAEDCTMPASLVLYGVSAGVVCIMATMSAIAGYWSMPWMLPLLAWVTSLAVTATVRVTADRRGLRIRSRIFGIPLVTVPLDEIASASGALIDERQWGQMGSTADPELITIIHRSGAALVVERTGGRMVVVTLDRPDEAAAVLEALRSASRPR